MGTSLLLISLAVVAGFLLLVFLRYLYFLSGLKDSNYPAVQHIRKKEPVEFSQVVLEGSRAGEKDQSLSEKFGKSVLSQVEDIEDDLGDEAKPRFTREQLREAIMLGEVLKPIPNHEILPKSSRKFKTEKKEGGVENDESKDSK